MSRSVPEWIADHDDQAIPPRVKVRIVERLNGCCYKTGLKLRPGHFQFDHIIALANGGEHREFNIAPICTEAHKRKTLADVAAKSKIARVKAKHLGLAKPKRGFRGHRKFNGEIVWKER
jgi:5-methylcytosine-specific restriction enzyme A